MVQFLAMLARKAFPYGAPAPQYRHLSGRPGAVILSTTDEVC